MKTLKLTHYQARLLVNQLCAVTDAGAEVLSEQEIEALDDIISQLSRKTDEKVRVSALSGCRP